MIVSWLTTNECNLKCRHCYQDAGSRKAEELTTAEAEKMIGEIAKAGFGFGSDARRKRPRCFRINSSDCA